MKVVKPKAMEYLRQNHNKLWTRSQLSIVSKVNYVTNNVVESFIIFIKAHKGLNVDDFMDTLGHMLMLNGRCREKCH
jgi:nucleoid-associated protein YejK